MARLSSLWRLRSAIQVLVEADDPGLMSRVADIFEQHGYNLVEESQENLRFASRGGMLSHFAARFPWLFDRIEIRRYGTRGWRSLHVDQSAPQLLIVQAVAGGTTITGLVADWGSFTIAYPLTIAACILFYFWVRHGLLKQTRALVDRAFAT